MKPLRIISPLMLPLCIQLWMNACIQKAHADPVAADHYQSTDETTNDEDMNDEEIQVLRETLAAGRGHRDQVGMRDQWSSTEHLGQKYDIRKPPSAKVLALLRKYQLKCDDCDHVQAVAKINAFVLEAKLDAERQSRWNSWLEWVAKIVTVVVLGGLGYFYLYATPNTATTGYRVGGGGPATITGGVGQARRLEIEEQRRRAVQKEREVQEKELPPTWRENEEREIWTTKQEKQFAKALCSFGGVPAKARYTLIADKVDGKNRQECLMHHKLLQVQAKEQ